MVALNIKGLTMKRTLADSNIVLLAIILCIAMPGCSQKSGGQADEADTEFAKLLASRPVPDLERLAERSAPSRTGKDATEAFYDILKLRNVGGPKAVPVLERIMAENLYSTRIHGYAAAQALFCIGAPEAHKILSKYLFSEQYFAGLGIDYTFHWEMDKSKRDGFIERYHLKNLSKDLAVKLDVKTHKDKNELRLDFTATLCNTSKKPFWIRDKQIYLGDMLYFQSESGRFARSFEPVKYDIPMPNWIELAPGASHQYNISVYARRIGEQKLPYWGKSKNATLLLETRDMVYDILEAGKFKVYAMIEAQPPTKKVQLGKMGFDNLWSGRAVSRPIMVDIREK